MDIRRPNVGSRIGPPKPLFLGAGFTASPSVALIEDDRSLISSAHGAVAGHCSERHALMKLHINEQANEMPLNRSLDSRHSVVK